MARRFLVAALAALLLVAAAGMAEAKKDTQPGARAPDVPAQAKALGLAKRAPVEEEPAAGEETAPPSSPQPHDEPAPSGPPAPRAPASRAEPAAPAHEAAPDDDGATARDAAADAQPTEADAPLERTASSEPGDDDEPASSPLPPQREREETLDDVLAGGGSATLAGATFLPGIPAPHATDDAGPPWWRAIAWALPLVGIGGVGAVLLLRRKSAPAPARRAGLAMAPVEPTDVDGLLRNGHAAVARGSLDEAIAWFDAALRMAPTLAVAHFCKGVCLAAHGRTAEAYGALDEAVWAAPAEMSYRVHFARVALTLGKHNDAMDALAKVTRAMPELGPAMLEDPQLAALRDHPRFLMICGAL